ncbi:MAG: hypothetical protein ABMA64_39255, partial [Myxococcota bacterium]
PSRIVLIGQEAPGKAIRIRGSRTTVAPGVVAPGKYELWGQCEDGPCPFLSFQVPPTVTVTIDCSMKICRVK